MIECLPALLLSNYNAMYWMLCWSAFHTVIKYLRGINLKGADVYSGSQFQRFQPMAAWLHCFGPLARQSIVVIEGVVEQSCSSHSWPGSKRERWRGRTRDKIHPSEGMLPITCLL
jgi:hypothetical protein